MQKLTILPLGEGVTLTCITTDQFKTACMSALFALPLGGESRSAAALLPSVLYGSSRDYAGRRAMNARLEELYGARVSPAVRKYGEQQLVGFSASVMDERFALESGESLTRQTAQLLASLLLRPGELRDVETEAAQLAGRVEAQRNDKRSWAVTRMYELMCDKESYSRNELGDAETLRRLQSTDGIRAYQHMLKTAPLELFYCGSLQLEQVAEIFGDFPALLSRGENDLVFPETEIRRAVPYARNVTEDEAVTQGKLTLGLRTGITAFDPDYPALLLYNACLGGNTGSRLFRRVREELSLCYYATSQVAKFKGTMSIALGIDNASQEQAMFEIMRELWELREGETTQEELDAARTYVHTSLRAAEDSPQLLEWYYQGMAAAGLEQPLDELHRLLDAVTTEGVTAAAKKSLLDTVYFMRGTEEHA